MTNWNEDNFLERLMPHLRHHGGSKKRTCPDSTTISAFMENRLRRSDQDAIANHLSQCPECAELHDRLVSFVKATAGAQDSEWENAEKRLAMWMSGFLETQAHARQSAARSDVAPAERFTEKRQQWSWKPQVALATSSESDATRAKGSAKRWDWWSWNLQLALSATAAILLVAGAVFLREPGLWEPALRELAPLRQTPIKQLTQSDISAAAPGALPPAAARAEARSYRAMRTPLYARTPYQGRSSVGQHPATGPSGDLGNQETRPQNSMQPANQAAPTTAPTESQTQVAQALDPPTSSGTGLQRAPAVALMTPSGGQRAAPIPAPNPRGGRVTETQPPSTTVEASAAIRGMKTVLGPSAKRGTTGIGAVWAPMLGAPPTVYQIEADTRLWIKLDTFSRQSDGSFTFQGSLLEPVIAGSAVLNQGTRIVGSGTVSEGKTILFITQIVVGNDRYNLKDTTGEPNLESPGTGPAVEFDAGRVLEMFLGLTSVYQMSHEATAPQPQR